MAADDFGLKAVDVTKHRVSEPPGRVSPRWTFARMSHRLLPRGSCSGEGESHGVLRIPSSSRAATTTRRFGRVDRARGTAGVLDVHSGGMASRPLGRKRDAVVGRFEVDTESPEGWGSPWDGSGANGDLRVVTHALTTSSGTTLWRGPSQHRGKLGRSEIRTIAASCRFSDLMRTPQPPTS